MLENNFVYISAVISLLAIIFVVGIIFIILKLREDFNEASKLHLPAVIFAGVYEAVLIVVSCLIIQDVILNIYCYLFLSNAFIVFGALIIYVLYYRAAKSRYIASKNSAVQDAPVEEPAPQESATEESK